MPNVQELLRRVEALIDDTLDTITVVAWFNGAQAALADVVLLPTKATIVRDPVSLGFPVPADLNGQLRVTSPATITGYEIYNGNMYLSGGGAEDITEIEVRYNRFPADVTNDPTQVPELAPQFHDLYVTWAAMQAMHPEEEPARYAQYERDFGRIRARLAQYYGTTRVLPDRWEVDR